MKPYIVAAIIAMAVTGNILNSGESISNDCQHEECFNLGNIDCNNITYSADWGPDKIVWVMKHCIGAEEELN
ncbi:MAG: hypothetical protein WB975_12590 [Nitrososphaeraceae archaeon]